MMKNLTLEHIAAACHGTYYGSREKKKTWPVVPITARKKKRVSALKQ